MNKTKIMLESFGERVRLSLCPGQSEIAANMFANLLWVMGGNGMEESFTISRDTLAKSVKAFRCANIMQARRGKGLLKQSPFTFALVAQKNDIRNIIGAGDYLIGNADYQNATDSEFAGYESRLQVA